MRLNRNGQYWLARWTLNGHRGHKSIGLIADLSRRGAEVLCRQIQADLTAGVARGTAPRLSEWINQYSRFRTDLGIGAVRILEHTSRYLRAFFTDDPSIDRITPLAASEWRAALKRGELARVNLNRRPRDTLKSGTKNRPYRANIDGAGPRALSDASVAKHVRTAKRMFSEAVTLEVIRANPFRNLRGKAPEVDKSWAIVSSTDMANILLACPAPAWKAMFSLCRWAGLRRGEALRLEWQDVLWDQNKLIVNARVRRGTKMRVRVAPIEPARLPSGLTALLLEVYRAAPEGSSLVAAGIKFATIDQDARKIVARAGLTYAKPFHTLRRNREAELAAEYPPHVFAEWQGHSPEIAMRYYLRVEESLYAPPESAKELAKNLGGLL